MCKNIHKPLILGASISNCVHIAGVANFLRFAETMGFRTVFLGAAIEPEIIVESIDKLSPDVVGISYRLTPETGAKILHKFIELLNDRKVLLLFGGTPSMVEVARNTGRFMHMFVGDEPIAMIEQVLKVIIGGSIKKCETQIDTHYLSVVNKLDNIKTYTYSNHPIPLIRGHFGLPDLEETIKGVKKIAKAKVLDIISIAPDQNAQQFFFRSDQMNSELDGAGGVPLRKPEDLDRLWEAGQRGNYPLFRIYSGTQDLLKWADMSVKHLHNAWGAVPLFWYSELDGRSQRSIEKAICENQQVIQWYAKHSLPVEILEAHQWSLRDAPDSVAVAMAYIGAYNLKVFGVKDFIAQYMFNTPRFTSPLYDLAKMTAKLLLIESLRSNTFIPWRQVRPGLSHFSTDLDTAKGQLSSAVMNALGIRPHIVHVVSYTEGDHAATAKEVIESCKIVQGVIKNSILGSADPLRDERISVIREELLKEVSWLLGTIYNLGKHLGAIDPFVDPQTLAIAVKAGILDAPHLKGQKCALGKVNTVPFGGGCKVVNTDTGKVLMERDRLLSVLRTDLSKKMIGPKACKLIAQFELSRNMSQDTLKLCF